MAAAGNSGIKQLLKCFCGCSEFTAEELCHIGGLTASKMFAHEKASQLFQSYLEKERSGDKSIAEQQLDVYKMCEQFLAKGTHLSSDQLDNLTKSGLKSDLEDELLAEVRGGDAEKIKEPLRNIQKQCCNDIDASQEYKNFKKAIADKLEYNKQNAK